MILIDANLLIYASDKFSDFHLNAKRWLDGRLTEGVRVGLPWPSLLAFLRVVTNPRIYTQPASTTDAWDQVRAWLSRDVVWVPQPT